MVKKWVADSDCELLTKAAHDASFLVDDLRALVSAESPLVAELGADLLAEAVKIRQKLERLVVVANEE
jgi:hypothetical protein